MDWSSFKGQFLAQAQSIEKDPSGASIVVTGSVTLLQSYMTVVAGCSSPNEIPQIHNEFRTAHQALGLIATDISPPELGTAMAAQDVVTYLFVAPSVNTSAAAPSYGRRAVGIVGDPLAVQFSIELKQAGTFAPDRYFKASSAATVWGFVEDSHQPPFTTGAFAHYPCRLGLESKLAYAKTGLFSGAWIGMTINSEPYEWHSPTFADCSWDNLSYWEPMGRTRPVHPACGDGLTELVTRSVTLKHVHYHSGPADAKWL